MITPITATVKTQLKDIRCLICDVDGVLTTGALFYSDQGDAFKVFNAKDGLGLKILSECGITLAVITGSNSQAIRSRLTPLGAKYIYQGCDHKQKAFEDLKTQTGFTNAQFAYIGDDWPDIPIMRQVGFAAAPCNAVGPTQSVAHFITQAKGGEGAVRELCELLCLTLHPEKLQDICQTFGLTLKDLAAPHAIS